MERFSYKGACGMTCFKAFKKELHINSFRNCQYNVTSFKCLNTHTYITSTFKTWSTLPLLIMYNCYKWPHLSESYHATSQCYLLISWGRTKIYKNIPSYGQNQFQETKHTVIHQPNTSLTGSKSMYKDVVRKFDGYYKLMRKNTQV